MAAWLATACLEDDVWMRRAGVGMRAGQLLGMYEQGREGACRSMAAEHACVISVCKLDEGLNAYWELEWSLGTIFKLAAYYWPTPLFTGQARSRSGSATILIIAPLPGWEKPKPHAPKPHASKPPACPVAPPPAPAPAPAPDARYLVACLTRLRAYWTGAWYQAVAVLYVLSGTDKPWSSCRWADHASSQDGGQGGRGRGGADGEPGRGGPGLGSTRSMRSTRSMSSKRSKRSKSHCLHDSHNPPNATHVTYT